MSKYGAFSGPYFPVFRLNTGKHGPGKIPYLDTFHAMLMVMKYYKTFFFWMSKVWKFQNLKEKVLKSTFLSSYGFKTAKTKWLFQKVLQNYYDIVTKPEDIYCWYFVGTISKVRHFITEKIHTSAYVYQYRGRAWSDTTLPCNRWEHWKSDVSILTPKDSR